MPEAVIVSTARTPIGKAYRGAFNNTHGATIGGHVVRHAVERAGVDRWEQAPVPRSMREPRPLRKAPEGEGEPAVRFDPLGERLDQGSATAEARDVV